MNIVGKLFKDYKLDCFLVSVNIEKVFIKVIIT